MWFSMLSSLSMSQVSFGMQSGGVPPDTQLAATVHLGLLSEHPFSRKQVLMPRKLKYVKSWQGAPGPVYLQ